MMFDRAGFFSHSQPNTQAVTSEVASDVCASMFWDHECVAFRGKNNRFFSTLVPRLSH